MPAFGTRDRARYTLPDQIDPPKRRCITIEIPDNIYHIAAFYGQMVALGRAYSWANDAGHTALKVARVWRDVFDTIRICDECTQLAAGAEDGETLIRQNPDNPCELQSSVDGTHWCTFADLSKCITPPGQPGSGAPQPGAGGGQACYEARMQGSGKWLLPTQVNTGDVIQVSAYDGAATDGSGAWFCGNGQHFFAGGCVETPATSGSDPAPAIPHMRLIAKIGSTYYDAYNTLITVPAGVSLATVEFQLNDVSLSDNFGDVSFKVCVTNNAATVWSHEFDFTLSDLGWSIIAPYGSSWIAGDGWSSAVNAGNDGTWIKLACPAGVVLTSFDMQVRRVGPTTSTGAYMSTHTAGSPNFGAMALAADATTHVIWSGSETVSADAVVECYAQGQHSATGNKVVIQKLVLSGVGADPF